MQRLLIVVLAVVLSSCSNEATELKYQALPEELSDCKVFEIRSNTHPNLVVMRCPNSTTTTEHTVSRGKSGSEDKRVIVVDGVEYAAKDQQPEKRIPK